MARLSIALLCIFSFASLSAAGASAQEAGFSSSLAYLPASALPDTFPGALPSAPEPFANTDAGLQTPWTGVVHYGRFSRMAVGGDISPLGIGIKGAIILTEKIDLRVMGNFFNFTGNYNEVDGVENVGGTVHFASLQTAVDWYPRSSIWRLSAGALLWNGNEITAHGTEKGGTSFTLTNDGRTYTYWSATSDPLMASAALNMHTRQPAFTVSAGFGRFITRSQRHWSFPSEFGVVFMGAPTISAATSGTVCTNAAMTEGCVDASSTSTPFYADVQAEEKHFQKYALDHATLWPIFSTGVMYSFNLRR
jgi:hypothetical protein